VATFKGNEATRQRGNEATRHKGNEEYRCRLSAYGFKLFSGLLFHVRLMAPAEAL